MTSWSGQIPWLLTGAFTGFVAYCNVPASWTLPAARATSQYLAGAKVEPIILTEKDGKLREAGMLKEPEVRADELWKNTGALVMAVRRPGCLLCRDEATELSKLAPRLAKSNIPFLGMVHEDIEEEIKAFKPFFAGQLFKDPEKKFFGPTERRIMLTGAFRLAFWQKVWESKAKEVPGNLNGDGTLLGSVFLIGPHSEILYEHRESFWGDHCNITDLTAAIEKLEKQR